MVSKALYVGYRNIDYKEYTNEKGDKLPAYKGRSYTFFQNKWVKGELRENGMFLNMMIKDGETQPDYLNVGEKYEIEITDINNRRCKLYEENDEEEDD